MMNLFRSFNKSIIIDDESDYNKLLIISTIHAVFIEFGFVAFDSVTKKKINGGGGFHHLLERLLSSKSTTSNLSLEYTVADLLASSSSSSSSIDDDAVVETVNLRFQNISNEHLNVHGSLNKEDDDLYTLCLDKSHFVPSINFIMCLNDDDDDDNNMDLIKDGSSSSSSSNISKSSSHERKVFDEFWNIVKDGLALPLLIDLCDKIGLTSPSCFTILPTDVKLKILEFLSGIDIAKIGRVSSELRLLCLNNDLWRNKVEEEFMFLQYYSTNIDQSKLNVQHWRNTYVTYRSQLLNAVG